MATSGKLLRQLFRGYAKRDDRAFRAAAEAIISSERTKNHRLLADDLEQILSNGNGSLHKRRHLAKTVNVPKDRERGFPLVDIAEFTYDWERLVISNEKKEVLRQVVKEHFRRDVLASGGLRPKEKVLFYGPPGCGKTLAAQVMASVLCYPLVTVRFDAIVSSFLGETAANLRRVFEFIQRGQWVVLFDEFDAIAKDRDNPYEHGELKRVINTLLQLMDAFGGESLLIASTNHEGLLDSAIWRRFEEVVSFTIPSYQERLLLLHLFLRGYDSAALNFNAISTRMKGATGSDIEMVAIEAVRRALLDGRRAIRQRDIELALASFQERLAVMRKLKRMNQIIGEAEKED
jgi:SpoVK/Ycf46/Vps4 family AAA+-type ATPase